MPENLPSFETKKSLEKVSSASRVLRSLAQEQVHGLPENMQDRVKSVKFKSADIGKPMHTEAQIAEVEVEQIFDPWILVKLKGSVYSKFIGYALNENGDMNKSGIFNPYSETPSTELGDELIDNIDFYERLLGNSAVEVSISL